MPSIRQQREQEQQPDRQQQQQQQKQHQHKNSKTQPTSQRLRFDEQQLEQEQQNQHQQQQQLKNDNKAMTAKNFIQRGIFYGPVYDVDHLATFTVGSKHGLLKAEDGIRKLRSMEKSQGIWTMDCQLLIDSSYLVVYEKKNGQEVEVFPIELVTDPTSVFSDDKKDVYNNLLIFTVIENDKKSKSSNSFPSEMHIFQCIKVHSAEIVDEIYKAKEGRLLSNNPVSPRSRPKNAHNHSHNHHQIISNKPDNYDVYRKFNYPTDENYMTMRRVHKTSKATSQIDFEVQILNHCFDDVERFINRLQISIDYIKELEKRQKQRKSHKKQLGDGMLTMRAQMPPPQHFIDILQKIKFAFNLLAKLKAHIHDPNAPELVHFLFTPLALIVNTTKEQPYTGICKTVWVPLLTKETKELLLNCLTSKEQDLWTSLGEGWTVTLEEVKAQPQNYANLDTQPYSPVFYDGWAPTISGNQPLDPYDVTRLAFESAAKIQANNSKYLPLPIQKSRYYSNTQPLNGSAVPDQTAPLSSRTSVNSGQANGVQTNQNQAPVTNPTKLIPNYQEMKKWAIDLHSRGVKVYEVIHDRQANNDKELNVKSAELLEVLDDSRNWWKLRNFNGIVGHAPITILRPFEYSNTNLHVNNAQQQQHHFSQHQHNNNNNNQQQQNHHQQDKNQNSNNSAHLSKQSSSSLLVSSSSSSASSVDNEALEEVEEEHAVELNQSTEFVPSNFASLENLNSHQEKTQSIVSIEDPSSSQSEQLDYSDQIITKINEINVILEDNSVVPIKHSFTPRKTEIPLLSDLQPMKGLLHDELANRMKNKERPTSYNSRRSTTISINEKSDPLEVKNFLESKGFSYKVIVMFGELNGKQLFSLNKLDFEKFCGREEGTRLDSQVKVQKSLCGYKDDSNELASVLQKRKEKTEIKEE